MTALAKETGGLSTLNVPAKPIIKWSGGKNRMVKHLLPLIPPHDYYVEPFCGGCALLLAKPRSKGEIINDLNGDLIGLYRCVQYHLPELERELQFMLGSRQNLKDFLAQTGLTDLQRAARFMIRNRSSFAADGRTFAVGRESHSGNTIDRQSIFRACARFRDRLDRVRVENLPYERILKLYDGPQTFFFLDPPYVCTVDKNYAPWTPDDMAKLARELALLAGRWLLTVNDSPENRDLFPGCKITVVSTFNRSRKNCDPGKKTFPEIIIQKP